MAKCFQIFGDLFNGFVKKVNGVGPDEEGNVEIETGGSKKIVVQIQPDNSCSNSFYEVYELVAEGSASFILNLYGTVGAPIQTSWIENKTINDVVQPTIIAQILFVDTRFDKLKMAVIVWGETAGLAVTTKNIALT